MAELIVALDYPDAQSAKKLISQISEFELIYKVGLELFMAAGPNFVKDLVEDDHRIFLDLKLHDIPHTVAKAALQCRRLGVELFTLHLTGGREMMTAVAREFAKIEEPKPKIIGVSVLTSFDDNQWSEVTNALANQAARVDSSVKNLTSRATAWGADGIVCSAFELEMVKHLAPDLYTVVPGIRPKGVEVNDQARVMTPKEAAHAGASAIVVGRPITQSKDPLGMVEQILSDLAGETEQ